MVYVFLTAQGRLSFRLWDYARFAVFSRNSLIRHRTRDLSRSMFTDPFLLSSAVPIFLLLFLLPPVAEHTPASF